MNIKMRVLVYNTLHTKKPYSLLVMFPETASSTHTHKSSSSHHCTEKYKLKSYRFKTSAQLATRLRNDKHTDSIEHFIFDSDSVICFSKALLQLYRTMCATSIKTT